MSRDEEVDARSPFPAHRAGRDVKRKGMNVLAQRGIRLLGGVAVATLAVSLAACGSAPAKSSSAGASAASGKKIEACMVTDTGGIDDKSFNQSAWAGLQAAQKANSNITPTYVASTAETDYQPNLQGFINHTPPCDMILAVGGLMGAATDKVVQGQPEQAVRDRRLQERELPTSTRCSSTPRRPATWPVTWRRA